MKKIKVGIFGLGLIGGSIFKALNALNYDVVAVSKSQTGENIFSDVEKLISCDVVFVCSQMSKTLAALEKLDKILKNTTVVSDVSSIKNFLSGHKFNFCHVPSHPMAGTEKSGFEHSFKELFKGAKWVIMGRNEILEKIIEDLGAQVVFTDINLHDKSCALISHAPMLLSFALFNSICDDELAKKLASSGFCDMTRLAMTNSTLALDMVKLNSENIDFAIEKIIKSLNDIKNLSDNDKEELFKSIAREREMMYKNGKNQK